MNKNPKSQIRFIENTISSLYEVENFLCKYNKISDILKITRILKKQKK